MAYSLAAMPHSYRIVELVATGYQAINATATAAGY